MSSITRQIVATDMLSQELLDLREETPLSQPHEADDDYIKLLTQFTTQLKRLATVAEHETENSFSGLMANSHNCNHIKSKQMLMIHCRLLDFVLEFYAANSKANKLLSNEFDQLADQRLNLLQTKAIKARAQYKTVAQALGKSDYQAFTQHAGLPERDWSWEALRISN